MDWPARFDKTARLTENPPMPQTGPGKVNKILIVRTSALGDVAHALPSLEALRHLWPLAKIHWIVEPLGAKLLEGHPQIDQLIVLERQKWKRESRNPALWPGIAADLWRLSRRLRGENYDVVIDFHCNLRTAAILLLAGGRHRVGFHPRDIAEAGGALFTTIRAQRAPPRLNKVEKNLLLIRALGFTGDCPRGSLHLQDRDRDWARALLRSLPGTGPAIAIHPAVSQFGDIKRWPAESYRELIDLLRSRFDAKILLTWGPGERDIAQAVERPTLLPEALPLLRFAAVLAQADLVIAADTGALPVAALLGTPTVGIYGPKDAMVYSPYPLRGETVTSPAPCSPCQLRRCEHRICMPLIAPQRVLAAAARALGIFSEAPAT